jgi:SAM-dependent methyltransferase
MLISVHKLFAGYLKKHNKFNNQEVAMRKDATNVEEGRLQGVEKIEDYPSFHERHRIFPGVFDGRDHKRILDVAAGVGCAARRIHDGYAGEIICNDITPTCLRVLKQQGLNTVSFDIDDEETIFPFPDGHFDAVVSLATIEHVLLLDHHMQEIHRILARDGYLYISTPNYAGMTHLSRYLLKGESFHDPLKEESRYEFYAHVRYFTFKTLLEFVSSFGFAPLEVYLPLPESSSYYRTMRSKSPLKAWAFRSFMRLLYTFGSPRWASEPVICFQKTDRKPSTKYRKILL